MATFLCGECGYEKTTHAAHIGRAAKCPKCEASSVVVANKDKENPQNTPSQDAQPEEREALSFADACLLVMWYILGGLVVAGSLFFFAMISSAGSAPQETAAGTMLIAALVAGYILAQCIEKIVGLLKKGHFYLG